ncbi:ADP-ribose pyrophosphatase YjhB, NUDIX family [Streptosporangium canum]|uniref:ADP-ribose pyrophosphatase YjhB, NUDIX family n=1 Tax=Streptosporangium canum TaxID=324952 RepID=A0A1I4FUY7_9ACTN|nr:NUDIX domain-containing protein [Streptosporangium canum]SFL20827.1 ADP-ribose pyrophosphatase YjhB, NUDIX family [Streptosporangium canum]
MSTPKIREAARAIVLDEADRVLLLRYDEGDGVFWATPGGALDPGEDHQTATRRELAEELGVTDVKLGPEVATRSKEHLIYGETTRQIERYFIVRIPARHVDPARATQTDDILAWEWWTLADLRATGQVVYPVGLTELIDSFLANGAPASPFAFTG